MHLEQSCLQMSKLALSFFFEISTNGKYFKRRWSKPVILFWNIELKNTKWFFKNEKYKMIVLLENYNFTTYSFTNIWNQRHIHSQRSSLLSVTVPPHWMFLPRAWRKYLANGLGYDVQRLFSSKAWTFQRLRWLFPKLCRQILTACLLLYLSNSPAWLHDWAEDVVFHDLQCRRVG